MIPKEHMLKCLDILVWLQQTSQSFLLLKPEDWYFSPPKFIKPQSCVISTLLTNFTLSVMNVLFSFSAQPDVSLVTLFLHVNYNVRPHFLGLIYWYHNKFKIINLKWAFYYTWHSFHHFPGTLPLPNSTETICNISNLTSCSSEYQSFPKESFWKWQTRWPRQHFSKESFFL